MNTPASPLSRPWNVAMGGAGVACLMILALAGFTRLSPSTLPATTADPVVIRITRANEGAMRAQTVMSSLAPLFLPTEYNARLPDLPLNGSDRSFADSDPVKLNYPNGLLGVMENLPPVVTLNGKSLRTAGPLDAIATDAMISLAYGLGRTDAKVTPLPSRGGIVEVVAIDSGEKVFVQVLPNTPSFGQPWRPVEFSAVVDAAGLAGPLELAASSRVEAVDKYFKNYLVEQLRIGDRLPPGFYRITVGP